MSRRKKEHEKEPNLERWLVSYADFITLLFAVFVTLYAMSQVDKQKADQVIQSLRQAFGLASLTGASPSGLFEGGDLPLGPVLAPPSEAPASGGQRSDGLSSLLLLKARLEEGLRSAGATDQVGLDISERGLVISLLATHFFDPGSATIKPAAFSLLNEMATTLAPTRNPISVEGFTDDGPAFSSRFPSNWELSAARAINVLHYLVDRHGFSPGRFAATGFAQYRPIADNDTEEGRRRNRRVDLVLLAAPPE